MNSSLHYFLPFYTNMFPSSTFVKSLLNNNNKYIIPEAKGERDGEENKGRLPLLLPVTSQRQAAVLRTKMFVIILGIESIFTAHMETS
jgi:hypothetical protein